MIKLIVAAFVVVSFFRLVIDHNAKLEGGFDSTLHKMKAFFYFIIGMLVHVLIFKYIFS